MSKKNITGIILAGGKSSRMGRDKGMIELNGKKFIDHIIAALAPNVNEIIIIANNSNYNNLGHEVYEDIIKNCGPLGGIYTGLTKSKTENNIVVSCDIPFLNSELIKYIIEKSGGVDITVPVYDGNIEPLCALFTKKCTDEILTLINNNTLKMHDVLTHFIIRELCITKIHEFYHDRLLTNINTPEELKQQTEKAL